MVSERASISIPWDKGIVPLRDLHFDRQHPSLVTYTPDDLIQEISVGFPVFPNKWFGQIIIKGKPCLGKILEKIERLGQEFYCFRRIRIDPVGDFKRNGDQSEEYGYVYEVGAERNPVVYGNVCAYVFVRYLSPEHCIVEIILGIDRTEDNRFSSMDAVRFDEFDRDTPQIILRAFECCMNKLLSKIHEVHAASKQQP